jgi:hypothetical protein
VAFGLAVLGGLAAWALILPARQVPDLPAEALATLEPLDRYKKQAEHAKLRNELRATPLQLLAGLAVLAGAVLAFQQLAEDRDQFAEQLTVTRQGQASERFTRAIGQLDSDQAETRIAAIHELEQVARQAPDVRLAVANALTAYVHRRAPLGPDDPPDPLATRAPDVQTAMTVLGRRRTETDDPPLDLRATDIAAADLAGTDLHAANLREARLRNGNLTGANLAAADLTYANLGGVILNGANLTAADLTYANFGGADLTHADLTEANLTESNLKEADLTRADLTSAVLTGAEADRSTRWPSGFDWRAAGVQQR